MQRGFIQIPILIAFIAIAVLGGGAYVAYEVAKPSQNASPETEVVTDFQATTTADAPAITENAATDDKDSIIDSLKKQVVDLTQKVSAPKTDTQNTTTAPKTTTVTLPSGAIVEMDANGNIVRTIKEAPQSPSQSSNQTPQTTPTQNTTSIQITNVSVSAGISSARIEWKTSVPTESKLFLTDPDGTPHVYNSASGLSTSHFVNMTLAEGLTFSYEIEAIAQGVSAKQSGTFKMDKRLPTTIVLKDGNPTFAYGGNCQQVFFKVGIKDQFGNGMIGESVSFFNPETNQFIARKTTESNDGIWATFTYYPQGFNSTKTMNFYIGDPPVSPSISTSLSFNIGSSVIDAQPGNFFEDSPTSWTIKTTGQKINPTTGMCL